jgi:UrcA family protein
MSSFARLTALVVAGAASIGAAAVAQAQSLHIAVGDLSRPAGATAFEQRVEQAARRFCRDRVSPQDLAGTSACRQAVRDEALGQLSSEQRAELDGAAAPRLASANHTRLF